MFVVLRNTGIEKRDGVKVHGYALGVTPTLTRLESHRSGFGNRIHLTFPVEELKIYVLYKCYGGK
jgi:hypothetical protein